MKTEIFKKKMLDAITKVLSDHRVPVIRAKEMALEVLKICEANPEAVPSSDLSAVRQRYPEIEV